MKIWLILSLCLFIFSSCDEAPQLSSISKIATTFNTGSTTYSGGLIVVGVREDAPGKISFSYANGISTPIQLDKGDWTFYGIGYAGPLPFSGTRSCGMTSVSFRKGKETSVNLNLDSDGCSGKLSRTLKLRNVSFSSCSSFYNYDQNTNLYNPVNENAIATYCNTTGDLTSEVTHYKITSINQINSSSSDGFSSCNFIGTPLNLPVKIVPFKISFHRSLAECQNTLPHVTHRMPDGLEAGDVDGKDFFYKDINTSDARLVLASTHTGKFYSAFINMLPRIICGTSDCTTLPTFDRHANVPWTGKLENQLVLRNVDVTTCSGATFASNYFSVKDCQIKNRHAYVSLQRNAFTCQAAAGITPGTIIDIYTRNGRTFVLSHFAGTSIVYAFTSDGILINSFQVAANTNFIDLAANNNGDIYVASTTEIRRFEINSGGAYNVAQIYPFGGLQIEVEGAGNYMFVAIGNDTISSIRTSNGVPINDVFYDSTLTQLIMNDSSNDLYSLEIRDTPGPPIRSTGFIRKTQFDPSTGTLSKYSVLNVPGGFSGEGMITNGYFMKNFHFNNGYLYTLFDGGGIITLQEDTSTGSWSTYAGPGGPIPADASKLVVNSGRAFVTNGSELEVFFFGGIWTQIGSYNGSCLEGASFTVGSNTESLTLKTVQTPTPAENNPALIEAGVKLNGRRNFISIEPAYYFKHMSSEQTRNTYGGYLSTVQRILGPSGVGGMLSDFTCDNLDAAVSVSPINRSFAVADPYFGYRSYSIQVRNSSATIPLLICDNDAINGPCTDTYDLQIDVSSTGLFETERYSVKLDCNSRRGEMEYHSLNGADNNKSLTYWNTNSDLASRYETYQSRKTASDFEAEIAVVKKSTSSDVWGRYVSYRKSSLEISSKAVEYQRDGVSHYFRQVSATDLPHEYPTNGDYVTYGNNVDLTGSADICLNNNSGIPMNSPDIGCGIQNEITSTSKAIPISIQSLDDSDTAGSVFQNVFTISP